MKIKKKDKIFIAGHNGLVGSAIFRELNKKGYKKILTCSKKKLDLLDQKKVFNFLKKKKPKFIFIAAAKVGGILTNNLLRGEFIYENLQIQNNLIHGAYLAGIQDLIFLGSSCVYPKNCKQPIKEKYLLNSYLEYTNEPYAIAKIAGIKLCENYNFQYKTNFRCLMPANVYGPNDNYDPNTSHFLPAILRKAYFIKKSKSKNKKLVIWGNGKAKREVLYVDDLAMACVYFMNKKTNKKHTIINIGSNIDYSINHYVKKICKLLKLKKYSIKYDSKKPIGTYRKLLDNKIARSYGWAPKISLEDGMRKTIESINLKNF
jgi:GDP-L-fucose synthase